MLKSFFWTTDLNQIVMLQISFNKNTHIFVSVFKELDIDQTNLDIS